jgi:hypothetical protein
MSGIGSIGSSPASSGSSSSLTTNTLPNGGLSSVGASLFATGSAPNAVPSSTPVSTGTTPSTYETAFANLQQYDNQELLYASFLSPEAGLANLDSVLQQAAQLLGTPGDPGPALTGGALNGTSPAATPPATTTPASSTSTTSSALPNLPSVASILAASDDEADQTLTNYANAPVGSSIIDYQA